MIEKVICFFYPTQFLSYILYDLVSMERKNTKNYEFNFFVNKILPINRKIEYVWLDSLIEVYIYMG